MNLPGLLRPPVRNFLTGWYFLNSRVRLPLILVLATIQLTMLGLVFAGVNIPAYIGWASTLALWMYFARNTRAAGRIIRRVKPVRRRRLCPGCRLPVFMCTGVRESCWQARHAPIRMIVVTRR